MTTIKRLLLALTPMGAAAVLRGGGTFGSLSELTRWAAPTGAAATDGPPRAGGTANLLTTRKVLLAMMLIGALAYFGGSGTWASFSAEDANTGNGIATGTLTLSDLLNGGATACVSTSAASNNNFNNKCDVALNVGPVAPGVFSSTGAAQLTLQNTGSIDASQFYLAAPFANSRISSAAGLGTSAITSIPITGLEGTVIAGDPVTVTFGTYSQTFTASATATSGATSISVTSATPIYNFPQYSTVTDVASNVTSITTPVAVSRSMTLNAAVLANAMSISVGSVPSAIPAGAYITIGGANSETVQTQSAVAASATTTTIAVTSALLAHASGSAVTWQTTDCSDAATPSTGANSYPTHGGDLNFAPTGGDPLCHSAILAVQEITGTSAYCWTGNGSAPENYQGLCTMPVSTTVNGSLGTGSKSSIPVSSLNGIVQANDTISVTDGTNTQTFQASGNVLPSLTATSIPITTATSNFAFASATVTDTTSIGTLASDTTDTIANFDTAHPSSTGKLFLYRLSGAGTDTLSGAYAANVTALTLGAALTMTIPAGSQIHIGGTNPETVTTTAQAAVGATTVSVSATTKTHSSGDAVSFVGLNTNALNAQLPKYSSNVPRTFWISVFLPAPAGATQNSLQGIQSTFGLLWHVDQ